MTRALSIRLDEQLYRQLEKALAKMKTKRTRNKLINEAIEDYLKKIDQEAIRAQLAKESRAGRKESMKILREFEAIDNFDFD